MKNIQGEIDIIKTQNSGNPEDDKVKRIDQLIKNYTATLHQKRGILKELVTKHNLDIKEFKKQKKWSVMLKSFPDKFIQDLHPLLLEKFFTVGEIAEKVDLIITQLRTNYMKTPIIIEDNITLIKFIAELTTCLTDTQRACEYLFDYGYKLEKFEDFKSMLRSNTFSMLKSTDLLLSRLLTEIREDTFSIKFNFKMLQENNTNILKYCGDISNEFQELRNKESIDLRIMATTIDISWLTYVDILTNKKLNKDEKWMELSDKVASIVKNVKFDISWPRSEGRRLGKSEYGESVFTIEEFTKVLDSLNGIREDLEQEDADYLALLEPVFETVRNFSIKFGKKMRYDEQENRQDLLNLLSQSGPWQESVTEVRSRLTQFEEL